MLNIIAFLVFMYCLATYAIAIYTKFPSYIVGRNSRMRDRLLFLTAFIFAPISVPLIAIFAIKEFHW